MKDDHAGSTTSALGQILGLLAWLVGWAIYDGFVLIVGGLAAAIGGGRATHVLWSFVAILAILPGLAFAAFLWRMLVHRDARPSSKVDWATLAAQVLGLGGLVCAVAMSARFSPSPTAELRVDNRTSYVSRVEISDHGNCADGDYVGAAAQLSVRVDYSGLFVPCGGFKATEIEIFNALGQWRCAWHDAKSHEPLVITEDGPDCTPTSYTPGILRQTPTTGGPPVSPPSR